MIKVCMVLGGAAPPQGRIYTKTNKKGTTTKKHVEKLGVFAFYKKE